MRTRALAVRGLLLLIAGVAAGCDDRAPVAPAGRAPSLLVANPAEQVNVLERATPLPEDITAGAWIGKVGGTITIPEAGVRLIIPARAVRQPTYISVTAHAGRLVSYEFEPHGTTFDLPLHVLQDIRDLSIWKSGGAVPTELPSIEAGYFPSRGDIDPGSATALVREVLPADVDLAGSKIRFDVTHFSGYLLASAYK